MNLKAYQNILNTCKETKTKLIAVSKTKPNEDILVLYKEGQRVFGENRVQELVQKQEELPKDIEWHFIGHLQKNKVKYIAPFVKLIHAVDSLSLLEEINKKALQNKRKIKCLIQFHIAKEDGKFGLKEEDINIFFSKLKDFKNVEIIGLMGMATFTKDVKQIRNEFLILKNLFEKVKKTFFKENKSFKEISMGMSGDYKIAIANGSTMIRVGSSIFGSR